jgi:hypothetical protein
MKLNTVCEVKRLFVQIQRNNESLAFIFNLITKLRDLHVGILALWSP